MFDSIDKLVRGIVADRSKIGKQELLTGIRHVHYVKGMNETNLQEMLLDITRSILDRPCATKSPVVNWINSPVLIENSPAIVIASKQNSRSLPWVEGRIHRDHTEKQDDVLSFEVFLDDIDENTGAIRVWENSMDAELDEWNKKLSVQKVEAAEREQSQCGSTATSQKVQPGVKLATGKRGTLHIWNGRILHQSMSNRDTKKSTIRLHWIVSVEGGTRPTREID